MGQTITQYISRRYLRTTQQKMLCTSATILYKSYSFLYKLLHFKIPKSKEFQSIIILYIQNSVPGPHRICCGQVQHFHCKTMKHFIVVDLHNTKCCMHVIQNLLCYTEKSPTVENRNSLLRHFRGSAYNMLR